MNLRGSSIALFMQKSLGEMLHGLSYRVMPAGHRVWTQVQKGAGEGLWLKLNPRTQVGFYEAERDLALRAILRKHLRPGMVFYDLGANLGLFALIAARIVGVNGKVFAFEPEPELATRIAEHAERNGCDNVCLMQIAVWLTTGFVEFNRGDTSGSSDYGVGRISSDPAAADKEETIKVPSIALDDFIQREMPPDFIKCDVEGVEVEVFEGGQKGLAAYKPIVECEVHSDRNAVLLTRFFQKLGYSVDWYTRGHFLAIPERSVGTPDRLES